nr:hypothetical protein [Tanacetum cinerariifolium]
MTENISYLSDFEEINRGYVAFGENPKGGKIIRKGKIKTGKLDFDDVYFVKELKFNLFSVSQMCDKNKSVLFTDTECVVLSFDFKLPDENHVLLRVPKENNVVLVTKPHNKTPYELLLDKTPTIRFMRPFGCPITILNTLDPLGKFDGKADEGFLVGYSVNSKAFRVFNSRTRIVQETLHINFLENQINVAGSGPKWLFDIDTLTQSMKYQPVIAGNQPNHSACIKQNLDVGRVGKEIEFAQQLCFYHYGLLSKFEIGGKSLFVDHSQYPDDPDMPALEDIVYLDDKEDAGVEADFSNLETNISVSLIPTTRVHKDHNASQIISELTTTPQTRSMARMVKEQGGLNQINDEDFHTCMFAYFLSQKEPKRVHQTLKDPSWIAAMQKELLQFKMQKGHTQEEGIDYKEVFALVARIEAIQLFLAYASFMGFIVYQINVKSAFLYGTIKEEVYVFQPLRFKDPDYLDKVYRVVKALYGLHQAPRAWYETLATYLLEIDFQRGKIDQTLFIKKQKGDILLIQMSSMGELTFLGLQVKQKDDEIFINQDKYVAEILRKFSLAYGKSASTPINTEKPLLKDPDDSLFNLVAYSDSDYARASLDRKSTTGGCQFLGCRFISWQCKKQNVVATSSIEAEYVVVASCCAQVLWIQNHLLDYGLNHSCLQLSHTPSHTPNPTFNFSFLIITTIIMAPLTFADTHNMIVFLTKSDASEGFDQIVDILNAYTIQYALMVNPPIYVSCIKQLWASVLVKKTNDVVQLQALIDGKKVVITEDTIRQDLRLDDADGVECLPNEEIFADFACIRYENPPPKLTFYKAFFSAQWKFLIHMIVQCMSMKRTAWNEFSSFMASAVICLATVFINNQVDDLSSHTTKYTSLTLTQKAATEEKDEEDEVHAVPTSPSPTHAPSPSPNEPITSPSQAQPAPPSSPPQAQPTTTSTSDLTLLNTLMETCTTLSHKVAALEQDKLVHHKGLNPLQKLLWVLRRMHPNRGGGGIEEIDADEDITLVDMETEVDLGAELHGRLEDKDKVNAAAKEVNAAEPTVFDDEEVSMTMAQTLIKMKAKKARILDEQMAKRLHDEEMQEKHLDNIRKYQNLKRKPIFVAQARKNIIVYMKNMAGYKIAHFKGMTYDQVRHIFEREYNKVQTFLKPDRDEEPTKKRVSKKTLLQESFKKLRAEVEVSVFEFKVEALQVKYPLIDWEIYSEGSRTYWKIIKVGGIIQAYRSFEDMLKDFDREDLDTLWRLTKENFSTSMPTKDKEKALWVELKRLYEPNAADVFWKLQRYMHDPLTWKLYTNCGVHQVSSTRRHDIFMFLKKDYPLIDVVLLLMPSTKLQVNEDCEMVRDLVMKIFMKANKPKSRRSLDTSSN